MTAPDALTDALVALHDAAVGMSGPSRTPVADYRALLSRMAAVCEAAGADYDRVLDTVMERSRVALNAAAR